MLYIVLCCAPVVYPAKPTFFRKSQFSYYHDPASTTTSLVRRVAGPRNIVAATVVVAVYVACALVLAVAVAVAVVVAFPADRAPVVASCVGPAVV